jgi:2-deoxy-D-gluconate 3-dehydrogenase
MVIEQFRLTDKAAIVTGASRGLGKAIALGLADAGAQVALASRDLAALREVETEIARNGRKALALQVDVSQAVSVHRMVKETTEAFGRVDILVNAAGTTSRHPSEAYPEAEWDEVVDVNLKGTFLCCQAVGQVMIGQGGGKIINIASLASVIGIPTVPAYAASKGGVAQLTKALAIDWARYHINVNAIGPGYFLTDMTAPLQNDPARSSQIMGRIPMSRWGRPQELQGVAVFLASEASAYITGQTVYVDGGWLAG